MLEVDEEVWTDLDFNSTVLNVDHVETGISDVLPLHDLLTNKEQMRLKIKTPSIWKVLHSIH